MGMDYDGYEALCEKLENLADELISKVRPLHNWNSGMYFPVCELYTPLEDEGHTLYLISCFKKRFVEFYDNGSLYRL